MDKTKRTHVRMPDLVEIFLINIGQLGSFQEMVIFSIHTAASSFIALSIVKTTCFQFPRKVWQKNDILLNSLKYHTRFNNNQF